MSSVGLADGGTSCGKAQSGQIRSVAVVIAPPNSGRCGFAAAIPEAEQPAANKWQASSFPIAACRAARNTQRNATSTGGIRRKLLRGN